MQEVKTPKKPLVYYIIIATVIMFLLNALVLPMFMGHGVEEVDYGTFLRMVERGEVTRVQVEETTIYFTSGEGEESRIYMANKMEDPSLVDRLLASHDDIMFGEVYKETSPIASLIVGWVLPTLFFVLLGSFMMRNLTKKMGGGIGPNAMSFGKSNAKIYVAAQTGKTFADVAGQDEAQEALEEIVDFLQIRGDRCKAAKRCAAGGSSRNR